MNGGKTNRQVLVLHQDRVHWVHQNNCERRGFMLDEAHRVIKDNGWTDAEILYIYDEIKKYVIKKKSGYIDYSNPVNQPFVIWYEAYCNRNINVSSLPVVVDCNEDYETVLDEILKEYLNELYCPPFVYEKKLMDTIVTTCQLVKEAFCDLKNGDIISGERKLKTILQGYLDEEFLVNDLDKSYAFRGIAPYELLQSQGHDDLYEKMTNTRLTFFRMRTKNKASVECISELNDIVHLPFDKSSKASEMRYSQKNEPCLYLGTTSFVCARECRWDRKSEDLYGSVFVPNDGGKKLKILNMVFQ